MATLKRGWVSCNALAPTFSRRAILPIFIFQVDVPAGQGQSARRSLQYFFKVSNLLSANQNDFYRFFFFNQVLQIIKQMANRLHQLLAATAAGWLCLLTAAASGAEDNQPPADGSAPVAAAQPAAASQAGKNAVAPRKERVRRAKKKGASKRSAFVLLSQRLLYEPFACSHCASAVFFDPTASEALLFAAQEVSWASARLEGSTGLAGDDASGWDALRRIHIDIQPLDYNFGAFNPFAGDLFAPLIAGPLLTAADAVSFAQLAALGMDPFAADAGYAELEATGFYSPTSSASASPFAYRYRMDKKTSVNAGVAWIQDLADTQGLSPVEEAIGYGAVSSETIAAVNFTLGASYRAFTLTGGYIRAVEPRLGPADLDLAGNEAEPTAWNSELAYSTELLRKETTLAVGYQKSSESLQLYLPEERYRTKASMEMFDSATLTLEYYLDKEYSTKDGGVEDEGYGITTKIGFLF